MIKNLFIILIVLFLRGDTIMHFYENIKEIDHPNELTVLVNKNNKLDQNFIPSDLQKINIQFANEEKYARKEAKEAFEKLSLDAQKRNLHVVAVSTYRSYEYQEKLYKSYVEEKGLEYADLCSARGGHSEHQTGLAIDVEGSNRDYDEFENSKEFLWMKTHAHYYGFILRYPKNKTHITGFKYEPWHYRYVGKDVATYIYNHNLTLEEYIYQKGIY